MKQYCITANYKRKRDFAWRNFNVFTYLLTEEETALYLSDNYDDRVKCHRLAIGRVKRDNADYDFRNYNIEEYENNT